MCQATSQSSLSYAVKPRGVNRRSYQKFWRSAIWELIFHSIGTILHLMPMPNGYKFARVSLYWSAISCVGKVHQAT